MAATATSFGDGKFGILGDETGMLIQSITHDFTQSEKTVKNRTGNDTGVTMYNEQIKVSLNAKVPKTSPFSGTLAASLTLINPLSSYMKGGVSTGLTLVQGITLDYSNEDYTSYKITATNFPNISS